MKIKQLIAAIPIAGLMCLAACGNRDGIQQEGAPFLNLMDRLLPVNPIRQDANFKRDQPVIRKGLRRNALVIVAPVRIHAPLQDVSGKATLRGWATQVFNIGDGLQMNLFLRRGANRYQVNGRYFDSGRESGDRDWIPIEVPLEIHEEDWLEIEILAGPQGNLTADWLALSSLELHMGKSM